MPWYHLGSIKKLKDIEQNNKDLKKFDNGKPKGLWLGYNFEWFNHSINRDDEEESIVDISQIKLKEPFYKVTLKKNINIITIDSFEKLQKFKEIYSILDNKSIFPEMIDWEKVSEDYDGIKVMKYKKIRKEMRKILESSTERNKIHFISKYIWFYALDINCMCIWTPSKVISKIIKLN